MSEVQKGDVQSMKDLLSGITYLKELIKSVNGKKILTVMYITS